MTVVVTATAARVLLIRGGTKAGSITTAKAGIPHRPPPLPQPTAHLILPQPPSSHNGQSTASYHVAVVSCGRAHNLINHKHKKQIVGG